MADFNFTHESKRYHIIAKNSLTITKSKTKTKATIQN